MMVSINDDSNCKGNIFRVKITLFSPQINGHLLAHLHHDGEPQRALGDQVLARFTRSTIALGVFCPEVAVRVVTHVDK